MKFVSLKRLFAVVLALAGTLLAAHADDTKTLSLSQAIQLGVEQSPALAAANAMAKAMAEQVPQAGALPDPRLSIGLANLPTGSFSLDEDPMSQIQVGISQALPYPGKLALQEGVAEQRAQAAVHGSSDARLQLVREIRIRWWQLFYYDHALEANANNKVLFQQQYETAQTLYTVGQAQQQDVLLSQLELARFDEEALRLKEMREHTVIQLNTLLNRSPLIPIQLPSQQQTALPKLPDMGYLQQIAQASRPDLQAHQAQVEAARAMRDLSAREQYPDFSVGAVYGRRDGRDDLASIQFSMSLPLHAGRKQSRAQDQRRAELMVAQEQLRDAQSLVAAEVATAMTRYRLAHDQVELFDVSVLPQARQTVEALLAGYQVNKVDFLTLVRAQTSLHNYETQYWQAYSNAHQALAELAAAAGKEKIDE